MEVQLAFGCELKSKESHTHSLASVFHILINLKLQFN